MNQTKDFVFDSAFYWERPATGSALRELSRLQSALQRSARGELDDPRDQLRYCILLCRLVDALLVKQPQHALQTIPEVWFYYGQEACNCILFELSRRTVDAVHLLVHHCLIKESTAQLCDPVSRLEVCHRIRG